MPPLPASLLVNVFDGARQPLVTNNNTLIRVIDGNHKEVSAKFHSASSVKFDNLPVFDNPGDDYTVIVSADGFLQAGFVPVHIKSGVVQSLDLMLLPRESTFSFAQARWSTIGQTSPKLFHLLADDLTDKRAAQDRYEAMIETPAKQPVLACIFNLVTAMASIQLPVGSALDYVRRLIWDDSMQQDRFYAWAEKTLLAQTVLAAQQGQFKREPGFQFFHKNATDSYKQIQSGEANVQLTFHANDAPPSGLADCIKLEPDIDYYQDFGSHALLEVIPNKVEKLVGQSGLSDPKAVYVLRWIAGRHAGVPEFNPPYTIIPA
jgi:hypothetical protein